MDKIDPWAFDIIKFSTDDYWFMVNPRAKLGKSRGLRQGDLSPFLFILVGEFPLKYLGNSSGGDPYRGDFWSL